MRLSLPCIATLIRRTIFSEFFFLMSSLADLICRIFCHLLCPAMPRHNIMGSWTPALGTESPNFDAFLWSSIFVHCVGRRLDTREAYRAQTQRWATEKRWHAGFAREFIAISILLDESSGAANCVRDRASIKNKVSRSHSLKPQKP